MEELAPFAKEVLSKRQPVATSIADSLREAILCGVLKGGDPLRQDAIAKQFAVSQVTVREAFRLLSEEGMVEIVPRRGAVVYSLSPNEVEEITELRVMLECALIGAAIPRLSEEDLAAAETAMKKIDKVRSIDDLITQNVAFHQTLYLKANRPRTVAILEKLRLSLEPYLRLLWSRTEYRGHSQNDHVEILALCRKKQIKEAQKVLRAHIEKTGREIEALLRKTG